MVAVKKLQGQWSTIRARIRAKHATCNEGDKALWQVQAQQTDKINVELNTFCESCEDAVAEWEVMTPDVSDAVFNTFHAHLASLVEAAAHHAAAGKTAVASKIKLLEAA